MTDSLKTVNRKAGSNVLLLAMLFTAGSCKKDPRKHNRYSTWTVNGRQYRSNNVEVTEEKAVSMLGCRDFENRYRLGFNYDALIMSGNWPLAYKTCWRCFGGIDFYVDTNFYILSPYTTNELQASEEDGKASYYLPPTWFHSYYREGDSVLIEGTFNEP